MASCIYCLKTGLVWGTSGAGKRILMELKPHIAYCELYVRHPAKKEEPDEAVAYLMALKLKPAEIKAALVGAPKGDVEARIRYALQARDKERRT